tara:strand:- start:566 stop:802 length:237 start_codon:yes stop_codon:yes gene_type:complete
MSFLIITNEHDMEQNIDYVTELAKNNSNSKIDIAFPNQKFATLFMENLMKNFKREKVKKDCGLHIIISVPPNEGEIND